MIVYNINIAYGLWTICVVKKCHTLKHFNYLKKYDNYITLIIIPNNYILI